MIQPFTIFSLSFLVTTLVSFFGAFLAWQRRKVKGAVEITWLMIASGVGAFWLIFETAAPTMAEKIIWAKLEYTGGALIPVLFLIFILRFTGKDKYLSAKNIISLFVIPLITLVLVFTNEKHNLIWSGYSAISAETNLMEYYHGKFFWFGYLLYSYLMLLLSTIYIFAFIIRHKKSFRNQGWIIILGALLPWTASILYTIGINVTPGLDLTPVSITLSGILLIYAIFHYRFLNLIPIARETLVETLQDGILALDDQNRIQDVNKAAISYLGITKKNILGLFTVEINASSTPLLSAITESGNVAEVEIKMENEIKTFKIIKQQIKNQPGSRLIVIRDITDQVSQQKELIEAKEKAEESDKLKSAFLANMSHEIRTPMNGILGFTEMLKEPKLSGAEQQEYIKIIENSGKRMLNIINDIINISKLETGMIKASLSEVDINEQLGIVFDFLKPYAEEKGLKLIVKNYLPEQEAKIISDKEIIYTILTTLTKNAIKFTHSGTVEIGCNRKPAGLEFFVKDTGIGIIPENKDMIFERFRQGSESSTRYYEGAGLGLSISKYYAQLLDGKIWVESEIGKGSVFYFTIPDKRTYDAEFSFTGLPLAPVIPS